MRRILITIFLLIMPIILVGCTEKESYEIDGYYNGELVCQHIAISSWVTGMNIQIKENVLFVDDKEIGEFSKKMLTIARDLKEFKIEKEHQDFFNNIFNIKEGYIIETNNNDLQMAVIVVKYLENYYLLTASYVVGIGYEIFKGYYLSDEVLLTFTDYPGGCIVMEHQERVKIGSTYSLARASEIIGINSFIDLETLTIYKDSFVVTKNLDLVSYDNGVYDIYIYNYLFNNNDFEFISFTQLDKIKTYDYLELDNGDILVEHLDINYLFKVSEQLGGNNYYLANISANKKLFDLDYDKAIDVLKLLYGNDTFETYLVTVKLNDNSFEIILKERTING